MMCRQCSEYLGEFEPTEMDDPTPICFCNMNCLNNYLIDEFEDAHVLKSQREEVEQ